MLNVGLNWINWIAGRALDGSATGLEANRYKLLMKIPLVDLNIARCEYNPYVNIYSIVRI